MWDSVLKVYHGEIKGGESYKSTMRNKNDYPNLGTTVSPWPVHTASVNLIDVGLTIRYYCQSVGCSYSIQRELALRRAETTGFVFTNDDARKLLRWNIMSEFW